MNAAAGTANFDLMLGLVIWSLTLAVSRLTPKQRQLLLNSLTVVLFLMALALIVALLWTPRGVPPTGPDPLPPPTPTATAVVPTATATATAAPSATPTPDSYAEVQKPEPYSVVPTNVTIRGKCSGIKPGRLLWGYLTPLDPNPRLYFQGGFPCTRDEFIGSILLGTDTSEFSGIRWIFAIVVDEDGELARMDPGELKRGLKVVPSGVKFISKSLVLIHE